MNEELGQLDEQLRELFVEVKIEEMKALLKEQPSETVKELSDSNWSVINKYYDTGRFELLFGHLKYVAYTCFLAEYAYQAGLISEEAFGAMMRVYQDLYEQKKQQESQG